jgi:hypothetical protein
MLRSKRFLRILLAAGALCAAPQAGAMDCELYYEGGPWPLLPSKWWCDGNPWIETPVSKWTKKGMGITWPYQNSHAPMAWVVCKYDLFPEQRSVSWHTYYKVDGIWFPYPIDTCEFFCYGQHT